MELAVSDEIGDWFRDSVLPRFQAKEITLTPGAQAIFMLAMSCQMADGMVESVDELFRRASLMMDLGIGVYIGRHGTDAPMNANLAIHFMVDANESLRQMHAMFPWRQTSPQRQAFSPFRSEEGLA